MSKQEYAHLNLPLFLLFYPFLGGFKNLKRENGGSGFLFTNNAHNVLKFNTGGSCSLNAHPNTSFRRHYEV